MTVMKLRQKLMKLKYKSEIKNKIFKIHKMKF